MPVLFILSTVCRTNQLVSKELALQSGRNAGGKWTEDSTIELVSFLTAVATVVMFTQDFKFRGCDPTKTCNTVALTHTWGVPSTNNACEKFLLNSASSSSGRGKISPNVCKQKIVSQTNYWDLSQDNSCQIFRICSKHLINSYLLSEMESLNSTFLEKKIKKMLTWRDFEKHICN